jgi:hypothetical protein
MFKIHPCPPPEFGLRNKISLNVGLIQLCDMIPAAAAVMSPSPPYPLGGFWGAPEVLKGRYWGVGRTCPSFNIPTFCPMLVFP